MVGGGGAIGSGMGRIEKLEADVEQSILKVNTLEKLPETISAFESSLQEVDKRIKRFEEMPLARISQETMGRIEKLDVLRAPRQQVLP